jgi:hypothetical protein
VFKFEKSSKRKNIQTSKLFKVEKMFKKVKKKLKTKNYSRKWKTKITQNQKNKKKADRNIVLKNENRKLGQAHETKRAGGDY